MKWVRTEMLTCRRVRAAFGVVVVCVVALAVAVSSSSAGGAKVKTKTLTIGYITDLSGVYQNLGYPAYNGAQVAVNQVNSKGGIVVKGTKYRLVLQTCEANSDIAQAVACGQHFIRDKKLKIILGGTGPEGPPVAAITDPAGAIYMAPGTAMAQHIGEFKRVFVPLPSLKLRLQLTVNTIKKLWPGVRRIAFVNANDPTNAVLPQLVDIFEKSGVQVVDQQTFDINALDVSPQLTHAKGTNPDLLWLGWTLTEAATALKANQSINVAPKIYAWTGGGDCAGFKENVGRAPFATNNLVGADLSYATTKAEKQYASAFASFVLSDRRAARSPLNLQNINTALYFADAVPLLAAAIQKAGTVSNTGAIAKALLRTSINGVQGIYRFGPDRTAKVGVTHCTYNVRAPGVRGTLYTAPPK